MFAIFGDENETQSLCDEQKFGKKKYCIVVKNFSFKQ